MSRLFVSLFGGVGLCTLAGCLSVDESQDAARRDFYASGRDEPALFEISFRQDSVEGPVLYESNVLFYYYNNCEYSNFSRIGRTEDPMTLCISRGDLLDESVDNPFVVLGLSLTNLEYHHTYEARTDAYQGSTIVVSLERGEDELTCLAQVLDPKGRSIAEMQGGKGVTRCTALTEDDMPEVFMHIRPLEIIAITKH